MQFLFEDHTDPKDLMVCKNLNEAREFSQLLHQNGRRWQSGESYLSRTYLTDGLEEGGCAFAFNRGSYVGSVSRFESYNLLYWKDYALDLSNLEVSFDDVINQLK